MSGDATRPVPSLLRMKFAGGRFDSGALPSSTLLEITRLSRIFVALAEDEWRRKNPGRKRVPAGFAKTFELSLSEIYEGSAEPVLLTRRHLDDQTFAVAVQDSVADQAARRTEGAFISIIKNHALPDDFPSKAVHDIQMIFSSFDVAEYPRFWTDPSDQYDYTQATRKEFLASLSGTVAASNGRIVGRLFGINTNERRADMELQDGRSIPVRFGPQLAEDMKDAVSIGRDGRHAALVGSYTTLDGRVSELFDVTSIYAVNLPDNDQGKRLAQLLNDDPLGEVDAVNPEAAEIAADILKALALGRLMTPAIFPGEDGAVQLVWNGRGGRATFDILGVDSITARTFVRETRDRSSIELDAIPDWPEVVSRILREVQ